MSITSFAFILLVAVGAAVYYLIPQAHRWIVLLALSLLFYLSGGLRAVVYIAFTVITTYFAALLLSAQNTRSDALDKAERAIAMPAIKRKKRSVAAAVMVLNFGLLYVVKYWSFTAAFINSAFTTVLPELELLMPLGMSFYTFQSIGYIIDVYRSKKPERNILKHALFISYFPQLIQGPIGRYGALAPEFYNSEFSFDSLKDGIQLMIRGYLKKLVIADRAAVVVSAVIGNYTSYSGSVILVSMILYCVQLYCDFSGGIDIVRGVSRLYGIEMAENFKQPIFATSLADFWRRWHISLGTWMKDYLFYPLSLSKPFIRLGKFTRRKVGGRLGKIIPTALATFIIYFVIGIWHGAELKYIAFGIYNGIIISTAQLLKPTFTDTKKRLGITEDNAVFNAYRMLRTSLLVLAGRYITRSAGLYRAADMLRITLTGFKIGSLNDGTMLTLGLTSADFCIIIIGIAVLLIAEALDEYRGGSAKALDNSPAIVQWLTLMAALVVLVIFGIFRGDYIAAEFIYKQF